MVKGLQFNPVVKLFFCNESGDSKFSLSPSVVALCRGVRETGSLSGAAYAEQMSYSKAWTLIKGVEKNMGIQLLVSRGPGGSLLTPECEQLLAVYDETLQSLQGDADRMVG